MEIDEKFIYVFDKKSRDTLLKAGFDLVAAYEKKDTYIFANDNKLTFALQDVSYFPSNKLTF